MGIFFVNRNPSVFTTAKVIPEITRTGPLIICCTRLIPCYCTSRGIDQIQASLKNYSECLYITDPVSGRSKNSLPINTQIRPPAN